MQGVQQDMRISPRTKARTAGSQSVPSTKTPKEKAKLPSSGSKLCGSGTHQSSVSKKGRALSKGIEDVTDFKSLPTPIDLFEDECAFCHSFRKSVFHGPMVCYLRGRIVSSDEGSPSNGTSVHRNCLDWAPRIWYEGDNVRNINKEIRRASRLKCHRCGLWGAALGCFYKLCKKSFHVPCAVQIDGCRWDADNRSVLCPEHVSQALPCDKLSSKTKERHQFSSLPQPQSQCSHKEETLQVEVQQVDQLNTRSSSSPLGQCSETVLIFYDDQVENQQTDQIKASNLSLIPQTPRCAIFHHFCTASCCPVGTGMSSARQGEEMQEDQQETSSYHSNKWVLLGLSLSPSEKDTLEDFACSTGATVTNEWDDSVTHVIVGKYAGTTWHRAYEVLMAILLGKWVVGVKWIVDYLNMRRDLEDSYEVTFTDDPIKPLDGPKKGRTRAAEGAPKLFSGLHFYLSEYMNPSDGGRTRNLIEAAGGLVLERSGGSGSLHWPGDSSPRPYFVYDGSAPEEFSASLLRMEMAEAREHAVAGARVISHLRVMDAVAAYDAEVLEQRLESERLRSIAPLRH